MSGPAPQRVMIIDDERELRTMLASALRSWGHEVHEAATVADGRRAVLDWRPHVVLVDHHVHGEKGTDLAFELCEQVPLVAVLSGDRKLHPVPGVPLLRKPFSLDALRRLVDGDADD